MTCLRISDRGLAPVQGSRCEPAEIGLRDAGRSCWLSRDLQIALLDFVVEGLVAGDEQASGSLAELVRPGAV
jgi:hypothetical protein